MMRVLILRLDAPLMSFGAPIIDRHGVIQPYPALSMLTGLIGNALGWNHSDATLLSDLQRRIRYACRADRAGLLLQDYQTVDLGQVHLTDSHAWTTTGSLQTREGGTAAKGTHIRLRDFMVDAVVTVALGLEPERATPTLADVEKALQRPARPLYIGRKPCIPSEPLCVGSLEASTPLEALIQAPLSPRADKRDSYPAWWTVLARDSQVHQESVQENLRLPVTDERDWINQIHIGERWMANGEVWTAKQSTTHA